MLLPFTWPDFEREIGQELPVTVKRRLTRCARNVTPDTWLNARSIVVAPHMSIMGQTLWQCVEAVTLTKVTADDVPSQHAVIMALCFAAGTPCPQ